MSNTTAEKKTLKKVLALWKRTSKNGKAYFSGKVDDGTFENDFNVTAFYNTDKKNLKEPDLKIYARDDEGNLSKEPLLSLWCNPTKNGKKVLSGKLDGKRVVGFINEKASEKQPYISVYYSNDDFPSEKAAPEQISIPEDKKGKKPTKKKEEPKYEEIPADDSLPF